jgi:anaerobic selenocysteine-containing dehydrogenase
MLNDTFTNDPKIARRLGVATVALNPADAAERGLAAGDAVVLANETGELTLTVALSDVVRPGVALSPKGRWPRSEPGGANVNVLNPGEKADLGASTAVHSVEVDVRPVP